MLSSSCLCGAVRWEAEGPLQLMSHCHCTRCRKAHGSPFATYVGVPEAGFRLMGVEHLVSWQSSPEMVRSFCGTCGSVAPLSSSQGMVFVPAGNFDTDPGARALAHIFVASKAPWYEIHDDLPQFDAYPPGVESPVVDTPQPVAASDAICGSCLCGDVAFAIRGPVTGWWNCHCGRCRKARSAAHASNLFLPLDQFEWLRGEGASAFYKVPEALRFGQSFCRRCGSITPRCDADRGLAIVAAGSLDDDPGVRPQAHIFVDSRAPWFEIRDSLPQHAAYPA